MKIAHVVAHPIEPPTSGGTVKTAAVMSALAACGDLHVVCEDHGRVGRFNADPRPVVTELPYGGTATLHRFPSVSKSRRWPRGLWMRADAAAAGWPWSLAYQTPRHRAMRRAIVRIAPDVIVADSTHLAPHALFAPVPHKIVHTHNLESSLLDDAVFRDTKGHRVEASRLRRIERLLSGAGQVWGVRTEDLDAYAALGVPRSRLHLMPNVVPPAWLIDHLPPARPGVAVMFGSWWYAPNQQALATALDLWPRVAAAVPGARFCVAGGGMPDLLAARAAKTPGVELLGFVADLQQLLCDATMVVAPVEQGGGTKVKVLEGLASGRPVLASPHAAAGLELHDGVEAVIRPPGDDFGTTWAAMLREPSAWRDIGLAGQRHVRERFSLPVLERSVEVALRGLRPLDGG